VCDVIFNLTLKGNFIFPSGIHRFLMRFLTLRRKAMSDFTYFSLSVDKGLRGNIGKISEIKKHLGETYVDMMVFLLPNGNSKTENVSHIVNIHFPCEMFLKLRDFFVGDYVRVNFDRIDFSKNTNPRAKDEKNLYIIVKATSIELIRPVVKRSRQDETFF
jgi:hypothetical protein